MDPTAPDASNAFETPADEVADLRRRLDEAEETLGAIRSGEVDALVVETGAGQRIYTLQGAEWPYRTFVEGMVQGALTITREGVVLFSNGSFAHLVGDSGGMIGAPLLDFVEPEEHAALQALFADPPERFAIPVLTLVGRSGRRIVTEASGTRLTESVTSLVVTDLTERRRQAETLARFEALRDVNLRVSHVLESITDAYGAVDGDGRVLDLNQRAVEILGHPRDALVGRSVWDVVPDLSETGIVSKCRAAMAAGRPVELEHRVASSGGWYEVHIHPDAERLSVYVRDITLRKRAEERLRVLARAGRTLGGALDIVPALEDLARQILPIVADWCVIDLVEPGGVRRIARAHEDPAREAALERIAPARSHLDADHPLAIVMRTGRTFVDNAVSEAIAQRFMPHGLDPDVEALLRPHSSLVVAIPSATGRLGTLALGACRHGRFGPDEIQVAEELARRIGAAVAHARLYEDLERRVRERTAELEDSNALLADSNNQMVAFSYSVAHDLRAPIRAIRGYLDALMDEMRGSAGDDAHDYAERIAAATERMDRLILDLLAYSRVSMAVLEHEPVPLAEIVREALQGLEAEVRERAATIERAFPPALPAVLAHRSTLVLVISNLVGNAMKFVGRGVTPRVAIRAEQRDDRVRVWVVDNGVGIAPEHQKRIFGVFEQLNPRNEYPGTGVGLAMVKRAVERMGGTVDVESTPGAGSRFWFELPAARAAQGLQTVSVPIPTTT